MKRILLCLALTAVPAGHLPAADRLPNIVFIFADDMGWADAHCYGHPYARTPNIDTLATDGTRFLQCYATGVTCCPSRTGFMTSRFPATFATYPANGGFGDKVTITELLQKRGYATGHFGKWHIGPDPKPGTYGIDSISGGEETGRGRKPQDVTRGRDAPMFDQAIHFIEEHKGGPFYVNVWDHIPHHPVNPSRELIDAFGPLTVDESRFAPQMQEKFAMCRKRGGNVSEHMRAWLAEIKAMDDEIGRLLKRIDELGLRDNTIVVFSSDQGPSDIREAGKDPEDRKGKKAKAGRQGMDIAAIRLNAMGYPGPFRGGKHNQYEGGIRIPFIVRWPGHVPAGRVDEHSVISGADWLPTLCAITQTRIHADDFDGEDASRAWLGGTFTRTKPLLWKTSSPQSPAAIRVDQWKLQMPATKRGEIELYDVVADPGERTNLASRKPDLVKRLSTQLEAWVATLPKSYDKVTDGDR